MSDLATLTAVLNELTTKYGLTRDQLAEVAGGPGDGGPDGDGWYPITRANGTTVRMPSVAKMLAMTSGVRGQVRQSYAELVEMLPDLDVGTTLTVDGGDTGEHEEPGIEDPVPNPGYYEVVQIGADPKYLKRTGNLLTVDIAAVFENAETLIDAKLVEAVGSALSAAASASRLSPFINAPAESHPLARMEQPKLYKYAAGGVKLNWPAEIAVMENSRGAGGSADRYRNNLGGVIGGVLTVIAAAGTNGSFAGVAGYTGVKRGLKYYATAAHPDVVSGVIPLATEVGIYGNDFRDGSAWGAYGGTAYTYAVGGLWRDKALPDAAFDASVDGQIAGDQNVLASLDQWTPFANRPSGTHIYLLQLPRIEIFPTVILANGSVVSVPWPTDARLLRFRVQAGTMRLIAKFSTQAGDLIASESNLTNAFVTVAGGNGLKKYPIYADGVNLAGVPDDTQIGWLSYVHKGAVGIENFDLPANIGTLVKDRVQPSTDIIDIRINAALTLERTRSRDLFISTVTHPWLRDYVVDFVGKGFVENEKYGLDRLEFSYIPNTPPVWRFGADVWNYTRGHKVGRVGQLWNQEPVANGLMPSGNWFPGWLTTLGADQYTGTDFLIRLADGQLPWTQGASTVTAGSYAACGIRPERLKTNEQIDADWFGNPDGPTPAETVLIGTGRPYTQLVSATQPFYIEGTVPTTSTYPSSGRVSDARPVAFNLLNDPHVEDPNGMVLLPGQIVRGLGAFRTLLDGDGVGRLFEATYSWALLDLALRQPADAYAAHVDNFNGMSKPSMIGDQQQHFYIRQLILRCILTLYGDQSEWGIGTGISSGQHIKIAQTWFMRHNSVTNAFFGIHNAPGATYNREQLPGTIELDGVFSNDAIGAAVALLGSFPQTTRHRVFARNCQMNLIAGGCNLADNDPNMSRRARDRWPYQVWVEGGGVEQIDVTDAKMRVAAVEPGTRVSGTLANAFFGFHDPISGRGDQLLLDGSIWSAGKNIGDRSSVNGTLVFQRAGVASETVTLSGHNFTGDAEGAVLAAINDQLTNFNVVPVRIDTEIDGTGR